MLAFQRQSIAAAFTLMLLDSGNPRQQPTKTP